MVVGFSMFQVEGVCRFLKIILGTWVRFWYDVGLTRFWNRFGLLWVL